MIPFLHRECRNCRYPKSDVTRKFVSDNNVDWSVEFPEYNPINYTAPSVIAQPAWADLNYELVGFASVKWNAMDGTVDRRSFGGAYGIDSKRNLPLNPFGRTGICGRGLLGRWGPNHAIDPVVTRWRRVDEKTQSSVKLVLEFIGIDRRDSGQLAIPGGMVDCGETLEASLKREFQEEVLDINSYSADEKTRISNKLDKLFLNSGTFIYRGYVDDPRNTDNSWIETTVANYHINDDADDPFKSIKFKAGDDAKNARWVQLDRNTKLYANHSFFLQAVSKHHKAHW